MGKFDEKRRCPPNGGAAHIREQTLPPLAKSRGYAPAIIQYSIYRYSIERYSIEQIFYIQVF